MYEKILQERLYQPYKSFVRTYSFLNRIVPTSLKFETSQLKRFLNNDLLSVRFTFSLVKYAMRLINYKCHFVPNEKTFKCVDLTSEFVGQPFFTINGQHEVCLGECSFPLFEQIAISGKWNPIKSTIKKRFQTSENPSELSVILSVSCITNSNWPRKINCSSTRISDINVCGCYSVIV